MASREFQVRITGVDAGGKQVLTGFAAEAEAVGRKMQNVGKKMSIGLTLPLMVAARAAFNEMESAQSTSAQTAATIKSTGGVANVTTRQVQDLSQALMEKAGVDDELIQSGANLLLTFKNVRNEVGKGNDIFNRATTAALDLSTAGFGDMSATSKMLGKALNDPIAGMTALGRAGVTFSAAQKETIKRMVEMGDVLGAQKLILREVESQVGGSAGAYGKTLAGNVGRAKEAMINMAGAILSTAAPAFNELSVVAADFAKFVQDLPAPIQGVIGALTGLVAIAGPVLYVVGGMARNFAALSETVIGGKMINGVKDLGSAMTPMRGGLLAASGAAVVLGQAIGGTEGTILSFAGAGLGVGAMFGGWGAPIGAAAGALVGLGVALTSGGDDAEEHARNLRNLRLQIRDVAAASAEYNRLSAIDTPQAAALARGAHKLLTEASNFTLTAFRDVAKQSPETARYLMDLAIASGATDGAVRKMRQALGETTVTQQDANVAMHNAVAKLIEEGRQAELTSAQIRTLNDNLNQHINAQLGMDGALINSEKALTTYNEATANGNYTSLAAREAQLQLQQSYIATTDAIMKNADANGDGKISADEARAATQNQIDTLRNMASGLAPGSPLQVWLGMYIAQLQNGIPGAVGTTISVEAQQAIGTLNDLWAKISALKGIPNNIRNLLEIITHPGRAAGGPVSMGQTYVVGEEGPELFVPSSSGRIIPNDKMATGRGSSVGGNVVVNLRANTIIHDRDFEDMVTNAIVNARKMGVAV